jgi:PBSX family phage terminase large subunit
LIEVAEAKKGVDFAIITRDANSFRRNVLPILIDLIGSDIVYKAGLSMCELWGHRIHLVGCSDQRSEGKLRGSTLQGALVDEVSIIPESSFIVLLQRVAMHGGRIFGTTNPDSSGHWLKVNFIDDNPDVVTFNFGLLDNPRLGPEERAFLERQHKGVFYRRFIQGEWCLAEGAIYSHFDEQIHVIPRPPGNAKFYLCGVDIGFSNATSFVLVGVNDELNPPLWVESEYYHDPKKQGDKTDSDYAADLMNFCSTRQNIKFIFCDPAALSFKIEMRRSGISIPVRDAVNDVLNGIRTVSSFLACGDLKILKGCTKVIQEMQGYTWDPRSSEKGFDAPIKKFDHSLDALRYAIFSYFGEKTSIKQQQVTPEALEGRSLGYNRGIGPRSGNINLFTNLNEFDPRNSVPDMSARRF